MENKQDKGDVNMSYKFESWFVDISDNVLRVECDNGYIMLIDTYSDPYMIFYSNGNKPEENVEEFEEELFKYLKEKYPEHF